MYIFCPLGSYNSKRQTQYSRFLQYVLQMNSHIYINSLVLSEFANRYLRLDFEIEKKNPANAGKYNSFKRDYMGSQQCETTIQAIKTTLNQIVSQCARCSDEFNSVNIKNVFDLFTKIGFNDSYYLNQAISKKWIIVSDDSDLVSPHVPNQGLTILTYKQN